MENRNKMIDELIQIISSANLISGKYFDEENNCMCAIGAIMDSCGINKKDVIKFNNKPINLYFSDIKLKIFEKFPVLKPEDYTINNPLKRIQFLNDTAKEEDRLEKIIEYLESLKEEEKNV